MPLPLWLNKLSNINIVCTLNRSSVITKLYLCYMFHVIQEPLLTSQDYLNEYREKHQNDAYNHMLEQRSQLPVFQYKTALIEAVKRSRVIVVKGATGCGKTTQVCGIVLIAHLDLILVHF